MVGTLYNDLLNTNEYLLCVVYFYCSLIIKNYFYVSLIIKNYFCGIKNKDIYTCMYVCIDIDIQFNIVNILNFLIILIYLSIYLRVSSHKKNQILILYFTGLSIN